MLHGPNYMCGDPAALRHSSNAETNPPRQVVRSFVAQLAISSKSRIARKPTKKRLVTHGFSRAA